MGSARWDIVGDGPEGMESMESLHQLEERLGYTFINSELLRSALYHSSYANEHRAMGIASNERLEFLGDAVLGFVSAEHLYRKHPDLPEGELTRIRVWGTFCCWARGKRAAADAIVPPFWPTRWRRCWPRCIWTAAWTRRGS